MPIPSLNNHGLLPEGIHDCSFDEAQARFGSFHGSDQRLQLWTKFKEFFRDVKACALVDAVILNGSFVTGKPSPNDIDLILVVPAAHDFSADLTPTEYNIVSKRRVFRRYGFDLLVARAESEEFRRYVAFFQ